METSVSKCQLAQAPPLLHKGPGRVFSWGDEFSEQSPFGGCPNRIVSEMCSFIKQLYTKQSSLVSLFDFIFSQMN